jgi:hypothetical protein
MDFEAIATEIHRAITGRKENRQAVQKISSILGKSQQTIYDCLYGRIKINLDFVKAAVQATEDPDIKRFLEPEGWILYKKPDLKVVTSSFEKEINDVFLAVSHLSESIKEAIRDGRIDSNELAKLKRLRVEIAKQTDEVLLLAEEMQQKKRSV